MGSSGPAVVRNFRPPWPDCRLWFACLVAGRL